MHETFKESDRIIFVSGFDGFNQNVDHAVAAESNAKVLVAFFACIIGDCNSCLTAHYHSCFAQCISLKAPATYGTNPSPVIGDEHSGTGAPV